MRKILLVMIIVLLSAARLQAAEDLQAKTNSAANPEDRLVNMDQAAERNRILDLEKRLNDLERNYRFLDDRLRSLDRSLDDLKRRR